MGNTPHIISNMCDSINNVNALTCVKQ